MALESDRRFRFPVEPDAFWSAIATTDDYRQWWPWLTTFEGEGLVAGAVWRCTVRPPLPYRLRFSVHLDDVVPTSLVTARIRGDITGTARLDVAPDEEGCDVRLSSRPAPSNPVFGLLATVARPLARRGHDWVLDTGAGQFADRVVEH